MSGDKIITWNGTQKIVKEAKQSSAGAGDAGKVVALDSLGKISQSMLAGSGIEEIVCSEDISAGNCLNIWDDAGTRKVRLADASNSRPCHGFARTSATSGSDVTVDKDGSLSITGVGLGEILFLSTTAGAITSTAPSLSTEIIQPVGIGADADVLDIEIDPNPMVIE